MAEGEDPQLFLDRVNKAPDQLAMLRCSKSVEEASQHLVSNLSSLYDV